MFHPTCCSPGAAAADSILVQGLNDPWGAVHVRGGKAQVVIGPQVQATTASAGQFQLILVQATAKAGGGDWRHRQQVQEETVSGTRESPLAAGEEL